MAFNFERKSVRAHRYQRLRKEIYSFRFGARSFIDFEWKILKRRREFCGRCEMFATFRGMYDNPAHYLDVRGIRWLNS